MNNFITKLYPESQLADFNTKKAADCHFCPPRLDFNHSKATKNNHYQWTEQAYMTHFRNIHSLKPHNIT